MLQGFIVMVAVAILAAGKGTRMKSALPKVLHPLGSRRLVEWVLHSLRSLPVERILVIVGYEGDRVREALAGYPSQTFPSQTFPSQTFPKLEFVEQREQLGTGHAVQQLLPHLQGYSGDLLVLNGDVPMLRAETLQALVATHQDKGHAATLLSAQVPNPKGYGRVFCDANQQLVQIIEDRDCSPAQKANTRVNAGVYCFQWEALAQALPQLSSDNDQQEYYLTDVVGLVPSAIAMDAVDYREILGINDRLQLADAYRILQTRFKDELMVSGVTLIDPDSITVDDTVRIAPGAVIEPQTHLRGETVIGAGCRIGPGSYIDNSQIGEGSTVFFSVVRDSVVGTETDIGPYAHLRGHSQVGDACKIGNFVELKKAQLGQATKASHLAYLGDATLGAQVNIGAGTITANYDGVRKHHTVIGDRTKTGANSVLVAPVTLGCGVTVGAGSTVTKDVPDGALVVARAKQVVKENWGQAQPSPTSSETSSEASSETSSEAMDHG